MGHSVRVRREEEKGTISWKIKFRNGTVKDFVSPITTKPWGKFIPKLADGDKPKVLTEEQKRELEEFRKQFGIIN